MWMPREVYQDLLMQLQKKDTQMERKDSQLDGLYRQTPRSERFAAGLPETLRGAFPRLPATQTSGKKLLATKRIG